jgi:hypothetical protein
MLRKNDDAFHYSASTYLKHEHDEANKNVNINWRLDQLLYKH